ncbi:LysR family transcriptional regulator [Microtetraspora malaysiensis]|uniref:LysR family transcriptional regulator n=1 Tax=Microtetraspora malaysiensis TaxID=161358 RepID=A0ABW6SUX2_9ACTN
MRLNNWPDLEALALLVTVSELGGVGRAARQLGISQPSASSRLRTLERRLGVPVLQRLPIGSRLTAEGQIVVDWAREVLAAADALMTGVTAMRRERGAALPVAASMTVAEYLVPGWLIALRPIEPDVTVGLQVVNSARVAELVLSGEAEVGFVEGPSLPVGLASRLVGRDRLVVVVSPRHPWARRRTPLRPRELAATPLIVREPGSGTRITFETVMARYGPLAEPLLELGSNSAVKVALASGAGPAVLSELAVGDELAEGRLVAVAPEGVDLQRKLRAVWIEGRRLDGPARSLLTLAARGAATRRPSGS